MTATNNNFSVEAIVTKYRNYVDAHTDKVDQYFPETGAYSAYTDAEDSASDEQLLITLYNDVAGSLVDKRVLRILSKFASHFYKEALSNDEYSYLKSNFRAAVSYMFSHKRAQFYCFFSLESLTSDDSEYKFIESAQLKPDSNVFLSGSLGKIADMAILLKDCNVYVAHKLSTLEEWAFIQIRLFAYGIKVEMIPYWRVDNLLSSVRMDVAIVEANSHFAWYKKFDKRDNASLSKELYDSLAGNGKMFIRTNEHSLIGNTYMDLKKQMIIDKSLASITTRDYVSFMGIRFHSSEIVVDKFGVDSVIMENRIKGQQCKVLFEDLDEEILLPSYYLTEKPSEGVSLSEVVNVSGFSKLTEDDYNELRKKKISHLDLGKVSEYKISELEKMNKPTISHLDLGVSYSEANIQNKQLKDYLYYSEKFDSGSDIYSEGANWSIISNYIVKAPCIIIRGVGEKMRLGYLDEGAMGEYGLASHDMICLETKPGIDVQYAAALLLSEEVSSVLQSIGNGSIDAYLMAWLLNKILVPNRSELERYKYVAEANKEALKQLLDEQKQAHEHYMKAVRMRKHALTQSFSSMKAMFSALDYYRKQQNGVINNSDQISRVKKTTVEDAFAFLAENFDEMGGTLERIADISYSFGKSEWIDPEQFIENYIAQNSNGWLNFKALIAWQHGDNQLKHEFRDPTTNKILLPRGTSVTMFYFPKNALEHILNNVVANARSHGFVNKERNDYQILFSWRIEGDSLIIEIANNGAPIPEEMGTDYILEYGTSTSLHQDGHNGIGCHEIDAIMREYDGRVRIVSNPKEDYAVKYELTFNHINIKEINL